MTMTLSCVGRREEDGLEYEFEYEYDGTRGRGDEGTRGRGRRWALGLDGGFSPRTGTQEAITMFDHEKLDVYRISVEFVAWAYRHARSLEGPDRHARDQLLRASQSIPLNIAEGNGKLPSPDRLRFLRIALGSALECAAILDVLRVCGAMNEDSAVEGKRHLERIVAMLTRMTQRQGQMKEEGLEYE